MAILHQTSRKLTQWLHFATKLVSVPVVKNFAHGRKDTHMIHTTRIAVIGLGSMGYGMAKCCLAAG